MFAQDEQRKSLGWLTFTMHTIRLDASQVVHANGQLIDGNTYDLDLKIQRIDPEAACRRSVVETRHVAMTDSFFYYYRTVRGTYTATTEPLWPSPCHHLERCYLARNAAA